MDNFFLRGMRWLNDRQEELSAVDVVYDNGKTVKRFPAVVGRVAQQEVTEVFQTSRLRERRADVKSFLFDFVAKTKYLDGTPKAGDRISVADKEFEVVNMFDGRCYSYVDNTFEVVRIHAQIIDGEEE